jgi:hypothetical protein
MNMKKSELVHVSIEASRLRPIRAEVLPMKKPMSPDEEAEKMLEELIQRKIAEAMENDSIILQPFMQTRAVSNAIRKIQNVIENNKFALFHAEWGCLVCGDKNSAHCSLGMCRRCHGRTVSRMTTTLRKANAERPDDGGQVLDLVETAQTALLRSLKKLIPGGDK